MINTPRPSRRNAIPQGLLGMIGLMVAVESFFALHGRDFRHIWGWDWRVTRKAITTEAPRCEVLCVGDSLMKFGLMPQIIEKRLGVRAFNLSLSAGSPPAMYFVFRHAIENGARPKAVLVDLAPHGFSFDVNINRVVWPELFDARDAFDLAWTTGDSGVFGETIVGELLPSVRWRSSIRANLLKAIHSEQNNSRYLAELFLRSSRRNRGAFITRQTDAFFGRVDDFTSAFFPPAWKLDPVNLRYVRRFLDLAARHRVPVYWLMPPFLPEVHTRRAQLGLDGAYSQLLLALQVRYPNLTVIDARTSGYGQDAHNDPLHLNRKGAIAFTTDVAEILAQPDAPASRWIVLPQYREPAPALLAEDHAPAELAVKERSASRQ
ncbi:MAG TPA: hypothetical protein VGZ22_29300 [Isosphaeraceae bacterium]|jgi:hypothetical protein|nr:hypothetical protein [Isosphaeraceae bacterium]